MSRYFALAFAASVLVVAVSLDVADSSLPTSVTSGTVVLDESARRGIRFVPNGDPSAPGTLAWGSYDAAAMNTTGWATLQVSTSPTELNDSLASYAAGYLEGRFSYEEIYLNALNSGGFASLSKKLDKFLDDNWAWMQEQVEKRAASDPYWTHVGALQAQILGLVDGQADAGGIMTLKQMLHLLILGGDMYNLGPIYGVTTDQQVNTPLVRRLIKQGRIPLSKVEGSPDVPTSASSTTRRSRSDHCSAVIRLLPNNTDVYVAHATWSMIEAMLRTLKIYDLPLPGAQGGTPVPGRHVGLSSFPGYVQDSTDDFYMIPSSGLVVTETTIDNDNETLAEEYASTHMILEWARNILANRLATDGFSWAETFAREASGTYTNSWMIVDTKLFTPGQPPPPGFLVVVEEMPGHISIRDRTADLRSQGYWASYNVASDPAIFNISGQWAYVNQYGGPQGPGAYYTYQNTSRAQIFARDAPNVVDEAGLRRLIRYNDFRHDPISRQGCRSNPPYSATNAIADRSDLNVKHGDYIIPDLDYGDSAGIDAKYTLVSWIKAADPSRPPFAAQSGPSYDQQPPFSWANTTIKASHFGMPTSWQFPWIRQPW